MRRDGVLRWKEQESQRRGEREKGSVYVCVRLCVCVCDVVSLTTAGLWPQRACHYVFLCAPRTQNEVVTLKNVPFLARSETFTKGLLPA